MNWDEYWKNLINKNDLAKEIFNLNAIDEANGKGAEYTKKICKKAYEDYINKEEQFSEIKTEFLTIISQLPNVHSIGNRIKNIDSLIEKIIRKRAEKYNTKSRYSNINGENYSDIITDLIGARLILHYQGQWKSIHDKLLELFPEKSYTEHELLPHIPNEQFMAEPPIAYYAPDDDISQYNGIIIAKPHEKGYRSIHYIISFKGVYIELQMRTIYDEAWSDYDHTYVYKKDANPNNDALKTLSPILCKITNAASDIGELMRNIFEESFNVNQDGNFLLDETNTKKINNIFKRLEDAQGEFKQFCNDNLVIQNNLEHKD